MELEIQIDRRYQDRVGGEWLRYVMETTLTSENVDCSLQLSLAITDDETVQELNNTYRGIDDTTDVLAFSFQEVTDDIVFLSSPHLGEVIVSYPQAARQAEEEGHSLEQELALLTVHGILHLLGYDHEQSEEEQEMRARETEVLTRLNKEIQN